MEGNPSRTQLYSLSVPRFQQGPSGPSSPTENLGRRSGDGNHSYGRRRGHSGNAVTESQISNDVSRAETWMDFLREDNVPDPRFHTTIGSRPRLREPLSSRGTHRITSEGSEVRKRRLTAPDSPSRRGGHGRPLLNGGISNFSTIDHPSAGRIRSGHLVSASINIPTVNLTSSLPASSAYGNHLDYALGAPQRATRSLASRDDIILPPWQPDSEVTNCPVCGNHFSFWFRKHHCRKCGRVICANCSPHRITIPRQFIVHSPTPYPSSSVMADDSDELSSGESDFIGRLRDNPALGGGEEVRVCNPCVPDPNQSPSVESLQHDEASTHHDLSLEAESQHLPVSNSETTHRTSRAPLHRPSSSVNSAPSVTNGFRHSKVETVPRDSYRTSHHRAHQSTSNLFPSSLPSEAWYQQAGHSVPRLRPSYPAIYPRSNEQRRSLDGSTSQQTVFGAYPPLAQGSRPPLQTPTSSELPQGMAVPSSIRDTQQQPQVAEEDECPICQKELPSKGPAGEETEREAHIVDCIASTFVSSSLTPSTGARYPPPASSGENSSLTDHDNRWLSRSSDGSSSPGSTLVTGPGELTRPRRATGNRMLIYRATEKDCVGEQGELQECVICFEEFEEGDEMGRLECLCKFHKACIRKWWETKGYGSCPTHQLHS